MWGSGTALRRNEVMSSSSTTAAMKVCSLSLWECSDRGHGGRVFGDIVDTFDSESRRLSDAVPRGVSNGREIGVCDVGLGRRSQRSAIVPSVRNQSEHGLQ